MIQRLSSTICGLPLRFLSLLLLCISLLTTASCEHPIEFTTSHIEVADVVVHNDLDTLPIAYTVNNEQWQGSIPLIHGEALPLRFTLIDFKGIEIPLTTREDMEIRMETENPAMLQWEPLTGYGILHSFAAGITRVRFLVWHGSHPDFITPWLTLEIKPSNRTTSD